jgi:hypothetical protein
MTAEAIQIIVTGAMDPGGRILLERIRGAESFTQSGKESAQG